MFVPTLFDRMLFLFETILFFFFKQLASKDRTMSSKQVLQVTSFPDHLLLYIFSFLDSGDLSRACLVGVRWKKYAMIIESKKKKKNSPNLSFQVLLQMTSSGECFMHVVGMVDVILVQD